jgi:hypothetical protein
LDVAGRGAAHEEKELNTPRTILAFLALTLVIAGCLAGCAPGTQQAEGVTEANPPRAASADRVASRDPEPAVRVPSEDAPGSEIPGLPRYPGSVRVDYERGQRGGLEMIHARYLTTDGLDAVRGYYRGVFRAKVWEVANAEFYEGEWTFLAVHGEREADIEIEAHQGGVTDVDIELSEPLPEEVASKKTPREDDDPEPRTPSQPPQPAPQTPAPAPRSASPAPGSASAAPQSASAAPQPASPAAGYYGDDDDFGEDDDFDDDGGGDD